MNFRLMLFTAALLSCVSCVVLLGEPQDKPVQLQSNVELVGHAKQICAKVQESHKKFIERDQQLANSQAMSASDPAKAKSIEVQRKVLLKKFNDDEKPLALEAAKYLSEIDKRVPLKDSPERDCLRTHTDLRKQIAKEVE